MFRIPAFWIALVFTQTVVADDKPEAWQSGTVDDIKLRNETPGVITDVREFEKLFRSWFPDAKIPKVDFDKNLILVATTRGSNLSGKPTLSNGDLKFSPIATADLQDGFRYLFIVFPKEGVKTVNGKDVLKK